MVLCMSAVTNVWLCFNFCSSHKRKKDCIEVHCTYIQHLCCCVLISANPFRKDYIVQTLSVCCVHRIHDCGQYFFLCFSFS